MTSRELTFLGLFPGLEPAQGGVQVAALTALPALTGGTFDAIVFGADPLLAVAGARQAVVEPRKAGLTARVVAHRWPADVALVWHIGMLKLLPLLRGFRGRVVMFCHGIELWRQHDWLTRRLLHRVDLFLSNSDYTWERFLEFAPFLRQRPHATTGLGFGEPLAGPAPVPDTTPSAVIIARMARAEDYKGHRELIAAWPNVLKRIPNARLHILGDGDLRPDLEALVRARSLGDRVTFFGRVSEERKAELLAGSRCLAMPSRDEGFGIVYLEAMRQGRPCLVSDCDAGREVVNPPEAGLAVDPAAESALTDALVRLLAPGDEWNRWSAMARTRYESLYTGEQYCRRLLDGLANSAGSRSQETAVTGAAMIAPAGAGDR